MGTIILWIFFSFVAASIASNRGYSWFGYFFVSIVLTPVVGVVSALLLKPNQEALDKKAIASGQVKKCPYCKELIKPDAVICKHCSKEVGKQRK